MRVGLALGVLGFAAGTLSSYLVEPERLWPRGPEAFTVLVGIAALAWSFRGRAWVAAALFLATAFVEIHSSFFIYGVLGPSLIVAPALVVAFGLFLGPPWTLAVGVVSVSATAAAAIFEPTDPGFTSLEAEQLLLFTFSVAAVSVLTALGTRALVDAGRRRRRADEQLVRSQRLAAAGTLAGGVAHDFNNLLTVIRGSADLIRADGGPGVRPLADEIIIAAERAAEIVRQLLVFSRRVPGAPEAVDPADEVRRLAPLFRGILDERVTLAIDASSTGTVLADPGQFEELMVNLVLNAREACLAGGHVRIATADTEARGGRAAVRIEVSDDGEGIPAAIRPRIFDPFFTTRGVGRMGLGLATVHGIVESAGAEIDVRSSEGAGTTVTVDWPTG